MEMEPNEFTYDEKIWKKNYTNIKPKPTLEYQEILFDCYKNKICCRILL